MAENNPAPPDPTRQMTAWLISNKKAARDTLMEALQLVQEANTAAAGSQGTQESDDPPAGSEVAEPVAAFFPKFSKLAAETRFEIWRRASYGWFDTFVPMIDMGPRGPAGPAGEFDINIDNRVTERYLLREDVRAFLHKSSLLAVSRESSQIYREACAKDNRYIYNIEREVEVNDYLQQIPRYFQKTIERLGPPVAISMTLTPTEYATRRELIGAMLDSDDRIDTLYLLMTPLVQNLEDQHSWTEIMSTGPGQYYCMKQIGTYEDDWGITLPDFGSPVEVNRYDPYLCNKIIYHHDHEGKFSMWVETANMKTLSTGEVVCTWVGAARCPFFTGEDAALTEFTGYFVSEPRLKHVGIVYPWNEFKDPA